MSHFPVTAVNTLARVPSVVREDALVYILIGLHLAIGGFALYFTGALSQLAYAKYLLGLPPIFFVFFPFMYFLIGLLQVVHRLDRRRGLAFRKILSEERLASMGAGFILLSAIMVFQGTFTSIKGALPVWRGGFEADVIQADIDKFLHGGTDPWVYLYDLAGNATVRSIVEWNYSVGWFVLCFAAVFWVAVAREARPFRTRYMICYVLTWIVIGNVVAGIFLSAGPAFYGHVTVDSARFTDQLAFLAESGTHATSAAEIQNYLWTHYETGSPGLGTGISAFPSMHVGLVALNALFLMEYNRRLGLLAFGYVALITASSVYLAWHYAIDGYASIVLATAIFFVVKLAMQRGLPRKEASRTRVTEWPTGNTGDAHSFLSATSSTR